jgi:hypothetical protein
MPGTGRPGDPLWFAAGFAAGILPGIYFHQIRLGAVLGFVLGGALALIRKDAKSGLTRAVDPLWFIIGTTSATVPIFGFHHFGLSWKLSGFLGCFIGIVLGVIMATIRADMRRGKGWTWFSRSYD